MQNLMSRRAAGVLLHPVSLPGPRAFGEIGREARNFVDFLASAGMSVWQMLPLGPTGPDRSPYQSTSAFAGNPDLIDLDLLADSGWLAAEDIYATGASRQALLRKACSIALAQEQSDTQQKFARFNDQHAHWLPAFALFEALRQESNGAPWTQWPDELKRRQPNALAAAERRLADAIRAVKFSQFVFFQQWSELRDYAHERNVSLVGDLPFFVSHDSADVWANPEAFQLTAAGEPAVVAGVPPDYFSVTGQHWGNPQYAWEQMRSNQFSWWRARVAHQQRLVDVLRVDHFRGFAATWVIPADHETAEHGAWVHSPGEELLTILQSDFGALPWIAEDLGTITADVDALRQQFLLPGMKILQFAFDSDAVNPYLPHNHEFNCVVYTGTHDNDTSCGWYAQLPESTTATLRDYYAQADVAMPWTLIQSAWRSVAQLAVVPMQDLLELGSEGRMNTPGTLQPDNWSWRFSWDDVPEPLVGRLRYLLGLYGRLCQRSID